MEQLGTDRSLQGRFSARLLESCSLIMATGLGHYRETLPSLEQTGIAM